MVAATPVYTVAIHPYAFMSSPSRDTTVQWPTHNYVDMGTFPGDEPKPETNNFMIHVSLTACRKRYPFNDCTDRLQKD